VDSKTYTLNVSAPLVTRISSRIAEVGVRYSGNASATGGQGPYTWSASGLPAGLAIAAGGSISGTPTNPGSYPAQVTVTDANGNATTMAVTFRVARKLTIATKALPAARVGAAYRFRLAASNGFRPVRWFVARGKLPARLRLDTRTGTITGTAHAAGSSRVSIRARDAAGGTATKTFVVSAVG
jgi:hypothetical protein